MTKLALAPTSEVPTATMLYERARALQPKITALAPSMEKAGRLDPELFAEIDAAGLTSVMVPKRFGGAGLGMPEASEVLRLLAQADVCTAWVVNNYMLDHLILNRFPMSMQERIFAKKPSFNTGASLTPSGTAIAVENGYRVTGRWGYISGILSADGGLFPAKLGDEVWMFVFPRAEVTVLDDWKVSAMSASESCTVVIEDGFVPSDCAMPAAKVMSMRDHHGVEHEQTVHRYPFTRNRVLTTSLAMGALETGVEIGRSKLTSSKPYGQARIDKPMARMRWAEAAETLRLLKLLHTDLVATTAERCDREHEWTSEELGHMIMDNLTMYHRTKDALRLMLDFGGGSSVYKLSDPLQRLTRDISSICTHVTFADWDVVWEKASRLALGIDLQPGEFY